MDRRSLEKLRTDRRLAGRKGWMKATELDRETQNLPDASGKIAAEEKKPDSRDAGGSSSPVAPRTRSGLDAA